MKHRTHAMHANSLAAYATSDFGDRERAILRILLGSSCPLCDREIMERLSFTDPNKVRPRVTEMIKAGILRECGNVPDAQTHRAVRTVGLATTMQETLA
jgi:hypothetical protein